MVPQVRDRRRDSRLRPQPRDRRTSRAAEVRQVLAAASTVVTSELAVLETHRTLVRAESRAARPFPVEPMRTLDAVHLATALAFAQAFSDLRVLSSGDRILCNARALGLE